MEADHIEVFRKQANGLTIDAYCWAIVTKKRYVLASVLDKYHLKGDYIKTLLADGEMYFKDADWRKTVKIKNKVPEEYKSKDAKRLDKITLEKIIGLVRE